MWSTTNKTLAAFAPAGQGFEGAVQVGSTYSGFTGGAYPFVAFDGAGNATAFWMDNDGQIYSAGRPAGGAFSAAQAVPITGTASSDEWPSYAVAGNGDAIVVWTNSNTGYASIRSGSGGAFSSPQVLSSGVQSAAIHVAMDPAGDAVAVWAEQINNQGYMRAAIRPAGASAFDAPVTLAQVNYTATFDANVAMDPAGDATIAWLGGSTSPALATGASVVTHHAGDAGFSAPQPLGSPGPDYEPPQVAYDSAGNTYVVWRHYDSNTSTSILGRVLAEVAPAGGSFSGQPQTISEDDYNVWQPVLAAGSANTALVVWPIGIFNGDASHFWIQQSDWTTSPGIQTGNTSIPAASPSTSPVPSASRPTRQHRICVEPTLRGLTVSQAKRKLRNADCGWKLKRRHDRRRKGRVMRVSGWPGKVYRAGHRILLIIGA